MVKKIFCILGILVALFSLVVVPISAIEMSVDNSTVAYDPILDNYPYGNLLPFPYRFRDTTYVSNVSIVANSDTSISFDGIASATSYNVISKMNLPVGTYVLSGVPVGTTQELWTTVRTPEGNFYRNSQGNIVFQVVDATHLIEVLISFANGYVMNAEDNIYYPMLSRGSTPFTWSPYVPYQLQVSNGEGYESGYDQGVLDGKAEYAEIAQNGGRVNYFAMPDLKLEVTATWGLTTQGVTTYENANFPFTYTNGKLTLPTLYDTLWAYVEDYAREGAYLDTLIIDISFDREVNYYGIDFFPVSSNVGLDIVNRSSTCQLYLFGCGVPLVGSSGFDNIGSVNAYNQGVFATDDLNKSFTSMGIILKDSAQTFMPSWLNNLSFETDCYGFSDIYKDGYIVGYEQGALDALAGDGENLYNAGLAQGYQNGYIQGKADGIQISEDGGFVQLFTAVAEAPVNAFMGLFDFEILGLDMRSAFGAILSLCVVLIVIKKVVF